MADLSQAQTLEANRAEGRHTALPEKDRPNLCPANAMPGLIIVVHGVNSIGEWYNESEQGLCEGLNDRLRRRDFQYGGDSMLSANHYMSELTEEGELDSTFSAKTYISTPGNSPVIRFRWGYKADKEELATYESQIWLDQKTKAWGGGPFQNGTSCLSDLWGGGVDDRLLAGVTAQQINPSSRPLYSAPPRNYFVHAADRLARLVERIRKRHNGTPLTIVCHSQGNMVGMAAALIGANRNPDYVADTYILCNPPYSPESDLLYDVANGGVFGRSCAKRIGTLNAFLDKVKNRGEIARQKQPLATINDELGFVRNGMTLVKVDEEQRIADSEFVDRDNRGKVFLYCNPHDQLIGASVIQGMGWRGLTKDELKQVDPGGKNFFIRVWAQGLLVGGKEVDAPKQYHYWNDHWLTRQNNGQHPKEWWYPKALPVRYRSAWVAEEHKNKSWLDRCAGAFGLFNAIGKGVIWIATSGLDARAQGTPRKDHAVPINAPSVLTPVMPASLRAQSRASEAALPHSDFDEGDDHGKAVREGGDSADRRLTRYEDKATRRLYEAQAKSVGLAEGGAEWREAVTERELQMMNFPPENATDHGTIVGNPEHSRHVMAWDVAIGLCRLDLEEIADLRRFADWRLGEYVKENEEEAINDLQYFREGKYKNESLKEGIYSANKRHGLAPGIQDGPQARLVYDLEERNDR
jgi:pimeloyl-ACP methyl ester carboxylesterase